jgi:hypothetical protein
MHKLSIIIESIIKLIDTDEKRLQIIDRPNDIFLLGFYYSKVENSIINSKIKEKINLEKLLELIVDEDYYKIYTYILDIQDYYDTVFSNYSF